MPFVFHKTTAIQSRIVYDEKEENINIRLRLFYIDRNFSYYIVNTYEFFPINITHNLEPPITYYDYVKMRT